MKYVSIPQSVDQLIETLLKKGLIINDIVSAKQIISRIGYFRLKRFTLPYHITDGKGDYYFAPNTIFDDIIDIYQFDAQLRIIIFDAISGIEVAFKSLLNYAMTTRYGAHWYLNTDVFKPEFATSLDPNYVSNYEKFISKLTNDFKESKESFIKRYKYNFEDPFLPPSWIVMEIMPFGTSCILYQNISTTDARTEVASNFNINQKLFETWLISMSYLRNQCAHHHKIIERKFMFPPTIPQREKNRFLKEFEKVDPESLYAILCIILYSLQNLKIPCFFKENLIELIIFNPQIDISKLGFTADWEKENIWQL